MNEKPDVATAPAPDAGKVAPAAPPVPAPAPAPAKAEPPAKPMLKVGPSPHLHDRDSIAQIMFWVAAALLPGVAVSFWYFGLEAVRTMTLSVVACLAFEALSLRLLKTPGTLKDGSALVTGILLGMNLPPTAPWWLIVVGALVAMVVAKHLFGGLGTNIFNPALVARVFLLVSWPTLMTTWLKPGMRGLVSAEQLEAVTGATPLGLLKEGRLAEMAASSTDLFLGNVGGSIGEISAAALLLGGIVLLIRRVITWEIPVVFIATTFVVTALAWWIGGPEKYATPWFHVLSGGLILGAFFMATDMVTSPLSFRGRVVFAFGCGLLTALIRLFGGYPEGVSFAILLMNAATPLIDHLMKERTFGTVPRAEVAK
jgi:electron transport complex protein RnfD